MRWDLDEVMELWARKASCGYQRWDGVVGTGIRFGLRRNDL